jgi:glycine cleavage system aminomethyltransferase T
MCRCYGKVEGTAANQTYGRWTYYRATRSQFQELHFLRANVGYVQVENMSVMPVNGPSGGQHGDCAGGQM